MDEWTATLADIARLKERIGALDVPWPGDRPEAREELRLAAIKHAQAGELCDRLLAAVTTGRALVRQSDAHQLTTVRTPDDQPLFG